MGGKKGLREGIDQCEEYDELWRELVSDEFYNGSFAIS